MKAIVTIGGGQLKELETLKIDREIVKLSGKKHPKVLFIPPASRDVPYYWEIFQSVYGKKLGCKTDMLNLINNTPTHKEINDKIFSTDIIYIGGGNSLQLMRRLRKLGIDRLLLKAYDKGIILSGISAGSLCWFKYGLSNTQKFYKPQNWNYIRVKGLGFIPFTNCPHYHSEKREVDFEKMIDKYGGMGIALDDNCALEIIDGKYRIISSQKDARAYTVSKNNREIITQLIIPRKEFRPLSDLISF